MPALLTLIASLGIILVSAEGFTNGIEWLGAKLHLSHGAVGSILAAVGTAMPETLIPIIAILFGGRVDAESIGIGAILGAPFMLSTLALFIAGTAALVFRHNGGYRVRMLVQREVIERDLRFFLIVYLTAILAAFLPWHPIKAVTALSLVSAYAVYAYRTVTSGRGAGDEDLGPLHFARCLGSRARAAGTHAAWSAARSPEPPTRLVVLQALVALAGIVAGAKVFVNSVEALSSLVYLPPFVLSLIVAPIATELPEKFNSVLWIRRGKDTLAVGNITGAMVFQSSVIPAVGMLLTDWKLDWLAVASAALALASAGLVLWVMSRRGEVRPVTLLTGGFFYLCFIAAVLVSRSANPGYLLLFAPYALVHWLLLRRYERQAGRARGREAGARVVAGG